MGVRREPSPEPLSPAVEAFASFVARVEDGESVDFDDFCASHASLAPRLRELHSNWRRAGGLGAAGAGTAESASGLDLVPGVELVENVIPRRATDRYEVVEEIASGGMGKILRVRDRELRRTLAMKVLHRDVRPDPRALSRFLEEAQVTAQLEHPGVVSVHDVGVTPEGEVFFTMPLVRGRELSEVFELARQERDGWSRTRVLDLLVRVCEALSAAHAKNVIHRDLKPSNVMVGAYGETFVMDWGLARVLGREDRRDLRFAPPGASPAGADAPPREPLVSVRTVRRDVAQNTPRSPLMTMEGDVVGTPAYMSPEQALGEVDRVGRRSDVYAVGAMLYELLSGRAPYVGAGEAPSPREVLERVVAGPPAPLDRRAAPELTAICEKAMSRDPRDRYGDARELAEDLRAYQELRVVRAYRTGPWLEGVLYSLRKQAARHRVLFAATALVVVVLAVATAVGWTLYGQARERLRASLLAQATAMRQSDQVGRRFESLELLAEAAAIRPGVDLRSEAVMCMALVDLRVERVLERGEPWTYGRPDPTLTTYLVHDAAGNIHLRRVEDRSEIARFPARDEPVRYVGIGPGGRWVAAQYGAEEASTLCVWDPREPTRPAARFDDVLDAGYEFCADGSALAIGHTDGSLALLDTEDLAERERIAVGAGGFVPFAFPAPHRVAGLAGDLHRIEIRSLPGGQLEHALDLDAPGTKAMALHPDGSSVVFLTEGGPTRLWHLESGEVRDRPELDETWSYFYRFDPSGELLFSSGWMHTTVVWDVGTAQPHVRLPGHAWFVGGEGRRVGYMRHTSSERFEEVGIWELAAGRECRVLSLEQTLWRAGSDWLVGPRLNVATAEVEPGGGAVLTGSGVGAQRWPVRSTGGSALAVGPPELFFDAHAVDLVRLGAGPERGKVLFLGSSREGVLTRLELDSPHAPRTLTVGPFELGWFALHPEGRIAATSSRARQANVGFTRPGVRLWDTWGWEELELDVPEGEYALVFSHDGRHLLASNRTEYRIWRCSDWELVAQTSLAPESEDVARRSDRTIVLDPGSLRPVVALEVPVRLQTALFLPDSPLLFVPGVQERLLCNVPAVRATLREHGLDWEAPPDDPLAPVDLPRPVRIDVLSGTSTR